MLVVNIPFNLYPIMLQRWNRGRVARVLRSRQYHAGLQNRDAAKNRSTAALGAARDTPKLE
jgi:hypothetical protein